MVKNVNRTARLQWKVDTIKNCICLQCSESENRSSKKKNASKIRQFAIEKKYSRGETINHLEVLTTESIQRKKVFKGGKHSMQIFILTNFSR